MIITMNHLFVASEYEAQFEERFLKRASTIDHVPGFLLNQVLRPTQAGEPYVVLTLWESQAAFENWLQSAAFRQAHNPKLPQEAYLAPNRVDLHEVIASRFSPTFNLQETEIKG